MKHLASLLILLVGASIAVAQLPTATILGVVKDSSGAVVPEATLTARNVETGQSRAAKTAGDGSYRFAALTLGNYEIRVEHPGFQSAVRRGLTLTVGQESVVNFTLDVGAVEQTVAVTAEAPLVDTTSGTLGGLVNEQKVADLPLNKRNYMELLLLTPGVQTDPTTGGGGKSIRGGWFSVMGASGRSNNFLLDGAPIANMNGNSPGTVTDSSLGVEGIREFRVVTNAFSAEYGMRMGSQMMIVSKGGTNELHGSLFEYLRNSALDARNFFDRKTALAPRRLPGFTRNQFGGSFGGPIKKDKTFFYGVYESVRERLGSTQIVSSIPASAKVDGGVGGVAQIAPVIKPFLQFFPDPNLPNNQFAYPFSQPTDEYYGQIRVDQSFSSNDTLFVRYTAQDSHVTHPLGYPSGQDIWSSRPQYGTLSESHIFSPTLLNTSRFSFSRVNDAGVGNLKIAGPQLSFVPGLPAGTITIGGVTSWSPGDVWGVSKQNVFTWSEDAYYTRGLHSLKFGALINRYQLFRSNTSLVTGRLDFANLQNFLLGQAEDYIAVTPGSNLDRTFHFSTLGFYVQDDWRMTSNLTLNLGLRYEFNTVPREAHGYELNLRDIQHDAQTTIGPFYQNNSLRNFSPRFGFAWNARGNGQTAIRGGFGLLYDIATLGGALVNSLMPPFASQSIVNKPPVLALPLTFPQGTTGTQIQIRTVDYHLQQPHMLQYNLTVERQLPFDIALSVAYAGSRGINLVVEVEGNPTVPQGLPVGGRCLTVASPPPFVPNGPKCWTGTDPRTNPNNWGSMDLRTVAGNSWYNSLQVGLQKRLSKGLQFQASYTWARVLDQTQGEITGESSIPPPDPSNLNLDKAPAGFDVTHNLRFNAIFHLPQLTSSGGVMNKLLNGWWVSTILSAQTGYGVTPRLQTNRSRLLANTGFSGITDRPDLVPGRNNDNIILGGPDLYFDPKAFTVPAAGFLGTAARNMLRGPGIANLDFSLVKDSQLAFLGESGKLEFRAEIFNILNRANFSNPNATVFAGTADGQAPLVTAGRITSTRTTARQIQLALKLVF